MLQGWLLQDDGSSFKIINMCKKRTAKSHFQPKMPFPPEIPAIKKNTVFWVPMVGDAHFLCKQIASLHCTLAIGKANNPSEVDGPILLIFVLSPN